MVTCSCLPPPASLKPRKIYNLLVPDVFDGKIPDINEPISTSTQRKIGKLQEYVQANPGKAGKVSRRLSRRIKKALINHELGHVKIAVCAYKQLLDQSRADDSSYTFNYFSKELIHQPDTLISTLLCYQPRAEVQALGAQLLTSYLAAQSDVEHHQHLCVDLVKRVLKLCEASGAQVEASKVAAAAGHTGTSTPAALLHANCLCVLEAYVDLCHKLKLLPELLEQIEVTLLDSLEPHISKGVLQPPSDSAAAGVITASPPSATGSVTTKPKSLVMPGAQEMSILRSFKPFVQESSSARRVVGALLQWFDVNGRWENARLVKAILGVVHDACGGVTYPLTSSLLRHAASQPSLTPRQRGIVARLAMEQGSEYSLSVFNLALLELPRMMLAAQHPPVGAAGTTATAAAVPTAGLTAVTSPSELQQLHDAATEVCVALADEVKDPGLVAEALATVLRVQLLNGKGGKSAHAPPPLKINGYMATDHGTTTVHDDHVHHVQQYTLECAIAVVKALKWEEEAGTEASPAGLPRNVLPSSLLPTLTAALSTNDLNGSTPALPSLALQLACSLLDCFGTPLRDDRQAIQLLDFVAAAAGTVAPQLGSLFTAPLLRPVDVQSCSQLVKNALQTARPSVLLHAARQGLQLGNQAAGLQSSQPASASLLLAVLADCWMRQLGKACMCTGLSQQKIDGISLPPALAAQPDNTLKAVAQDWHGALSSPAADLPAAIQQWHLACVQALSSEGVLSQQYGKDVHHLLERPQKSSAPPTPRESQAGSPSTTNTVAAVAGSGPSMFARSSGSMAAFRSASIRRDRLDARKVLEVLGSPNHSAPNSMLTTPQPSVPLTTVNPPTIADVLQLTAKFASQAQLQSEQAGNRFSHVTLDRLAAQLEPLGVY